MGHIQNKTYIAAEINIFLCFIFVFLWFRSGCKAHSYARSKTKNARSEIGRFRSGKIVFVPEPKAILREIENPAAGVFCGVSGMPAVGIIRNLNIRVLTQLRLELFRVRLLLYNCTGWMPTQSICTSCCSPGVATSVKDPDPPACLLLHRAILYCSSFTFR